MGALLGRWRMDEAEMRRRMYRAPTLRERERWHAVWLLAQGWTAAAVPHALERDAHTIGLWARAFAEGGPKAMVFEQSGGPPALDVEQRAELKAAVPVSPSQAGIDLSNWNWKVVRRFCCAIGWVSQSSQGTLRTNTILLRRVYTLLSSERWEKAWGQPYRTLSRG